MTTAYYATGRRKTSTARVFLSPNGTGKIVINDKSIDDYFSRESDRMVVRQPLDLLDERNNFDLYITVKGSGVSGQSGAIRHGVARTLVRFEKETMPESQVQALKDAITEVSDDTDDAQALKPCSTDPDQGFQLPWHKQLRLAGFVTRDPRMAERKKVGCRGARRRAQWAKR